MVIRNVAKRCLDYSNTIKGRQGEVLGKIALGLTRAVTIVFIFGRIEFRKRRVDRHENQCSACPEAKRPPTITLDDGSNRRQQCACRFLRANTLELALIMVWTASLHLAKMKHVNCRCMLTDYLFIYSCHRLGISVPLPLI